MDPLTIRKRQQENSNVVTFQHYTQHDTSRNGNGSNDSGSKRPRIASACDQCKKKKKACTGEQPCRSCAKKNLICHYIVGHPARKYHAHNRSTSDDVEPPKQSAHNFVTSHTVTTGLRPTLQFVYSSSASPQQQQSPPFPPPPPPPPPPSSNYKSDASFSNTFIQESCLNSFGYFGGSSVFSAEPYSSNSTTVTPANTSKISCSPSQNLSHMNLSSRDQLYLLDVYCQNVDTFYPVFRLDYLKEQLHSPLLPATRATSLNTLFFCALFARAAYLVRNNTASNNLTYGQISAQFIAYAEYIRDTHINDPSPTCSTVLALLILANHLECNRLRHQLPVAWKWAGEACTLAVTMGLHAQEPMEMDSTLYQLRLRTFWLAFITDYTIKSIHGRPFLFDEMDISMGDKDIRGKHPDQLQCTEKEDASTQLWINAFKSTISFCKGAKKIIKFNYSPQQKLDQHHSYYRGYLMTMDHWLYSTAKDDDSIRKDNTNTDDHPEHENQRHIQEMTPPAETKLTTPSNQRLKQLKELYFYADTMLLHKRYMEDDTYKHESRSVSLEICHRAAGHAISLASELSVEKLDSLSTCPVTLYSLVMALRLLGCILSRRKGQHGSLEAEAELLFEKGYHALHQLPIFQNPQSMMYDTLYRLWVFYNEYCAAKDQQQLGGEMLLKKPVVNNTWSCDFDHPFNAFLDTSGASSFIHQLLSVSANSTPATSSFMAMEQLGDNHSGGASVRQHSHHAQQLKDASGGSLNSIDPIMATFGDTFFSQQIQNDQQHSTWQHGSNNDYLDCHNRQQHSLCSYPSSKSSVSSSTATTTTALDSEIVSGADEGLASFKLFPTFGVPELANSYQQGLWTIPPSTSIPNLFTPPNFSSTTNGMNNTGG